MTGKNTFIQSAGYFVGFVLCCFLVGCDAQMDWEYAPMLEERIVHPPEPQEVAPEMEDVVTDLQIDLNRAIELALKRNPQLRIANYQAEIAAEQINIARSGFFPQVSGTAAKTFLDDPVEVEIGLPPLIPAFSIQLIEKQFTRAELQARWMLWDFGRTLGRYQQASHGADAARMGAGENPSAIDL